MLVFELRDNSLVSFTKAISAIDGLALVGEEATETDDWQKAFLYLMVPSQSAIAKLLALWKLWIADKSLPETDKLWELVFDCLHDLRRWGPKDRVSEPDAEIIKSLAEDDPTATVRIEIELVYERTTIKADRGRAALEAAVTAQRGRKVRASRLEAIAYDALLVDIPAAGALALAEHNPSSLAGMPDIYAIRPQSLIDIRETVEIGGTATPTEMSPTEPAIAAILDAVPVQNHPAFARHIDLLDPDDLQSKAVGLRTHGTAMISLVVRGDLKRNEAPLNHKVMVRPLMFAERLNEASEVFEPEHLLVDDFVRAILDLKVTRNAEGSGIFVVNISLGDRNRPFFGRASAWARAVDWLAHEYGILFLVSAGNATGGQNDIELSELTDVRAFSLLQGKDRAKATLAGIHKGIPLRRLLSPAEAVNAITVGALHDDAINDMPTKGSSHDPLPVQGLPTPASRVGPGIANAIKPDLLMPGGRLRVTPVLLRNPPAIRVSNANAFGGLQVAGPGVDATGALTSNAWSGATSGATALATRAAHHIHDALLASYRDEYGTLHPRFKALLVKSLLLHRCEISGDARELVEQVFGPPGRYKIVQRANNVFRMFGFGVPRIDEVTACLGSRASLWGYGSLGADDGRLFKLPIPACLSGHAGLRGLSVTLVWFTAVTPGRRAYRSERLIVEEPPDAHLKTLLRGATKHQADTNRVTRGTVFTRSWDGKAAKHFQKNHHLELRVARKPDSLDDLPDQTDFAFVATLEASELSLPIYDQVRARIAVKPQVPVQVPIVPQS